MKGPEQLAALLAGDSPERQRRFLLSGGILSVIPAEALNAKKLLTPNPDLSIPDLSVYDDPEQLTELSLYIYDKVCPSNLSLPCVVRAESEAYGGEPDQRIDQEGGQEGGQGLGTEPVLSNAFEYPLKKPADYKRLKTLDPETDGRMPMVLDILQRLRLARPGVPVIGDLVGPLSLATSLIEAGTLLRAFKDDGEAICKLLDLLTENTIAFARAQHRAGADAFFLIDPFSTAEAIGPRSFEVFALPYLNRIADSLASFGCPLIVHICGDPSPLAASLAGLRSAGLGLHSVPAPLVGLEGKLLIGGVDHLSLLGPAAATQGRTAIADSVEAAVSKGFSVISPSCSLDATVSLDALWIAAEAALRAGR